MVSSRHGAAGAGNDAAASPVSPVLGGPNDVPADPQSVGGGSATLANLLHSGFSRRGLRTGVVRRAEVGPVQEDPEAVADLTRRASVPESEYVEPEEPDEVRLDAGTLNMEEFRKLLESTVNAALEKRESSRGGAGRQAGTAGTGFDCHPEVEQRQAQYRRDMDRYDANRFIDAQENMYGGGGMELPQVTTGRQHGYTATVGTSKVTVSLPPAFDPVKDKWLLWKPQVQDYFVMVGLPGILDQVEGHTFGLQANRIALGTLKAICPSQDAAHISTTCVKFAYKAWQILEAAYGSRSELDLQKMLTEFEVAKQAQNETIRSWTIRLDRMVTELNLLASLAAQENLVTLNSSNTKAVSDMSHKYRLLNVRVEDQPHAAFIAALRTEIYTLDVKEVEARLITYEQGKEIQNALNRSADTSTFFTYGVGGRRGAFGRGPGRGASSGAGRGADSRVCFACGGNGHNYRRCATSSTPEGRRRLLAKGIDFNPDAPEASRGNGRGRGSGRGFGSGRVPRVDRGDYRRQAQEGELE
jgi:hypothetical protein